MINEHNLLFNVNHNSFTPGPGTLFVDPEFAGGSDFHLTPGPPARDAGDSLRVPADVLVDLDGLPRIRRAMVDIGAYEQVPEPTTAAIAVLTAAMVWPLRRREWTLLWDRCRKRQRRLSAHALS